MLPYWTSVKEIYFAIYTVSIKMLKTTQEDGLTAFSFFLVCIVCDQIMVWDELQFSVCILLLWPVKILQTFNMQIARVTSSNVPWHK